MSYRLSEEQKSFYHENGYFISLSAIYSAEKMRGLNAEWPNLLALLEPGESAKEIGEWHGEKVGAGAESVHVIGGS
jgi:hypothetical protein